MNQSILLNSDIAFQHDKSAWRITGFYQTQPITIYIAEADLARDTDITSNQLLDIEADIEDWLDVNEPDDKNEIWLSY